jgi:apolipoprotein N-acyltransferase
VFLVREGRLAGTADKIRLMPFSEASPLAPAEGRPRLSTGDRVRTLPARGARVGVLVCSESMHPAHVREVVRAGAELLANPSNDGWFGSRAALRQQLAAAQLRAIESRRYLVRAAENGASAVVDPWGRILARGPDGGAALTSARVAPGRTLTPYQRFGDLAAWLAVAGVPAFTLSPWRRTLRDTPRSGT